MANIFDLIDDTGKLVNSTDASADASAADACIERENSHKNQDFRLHTLASDASADASADASETSDNQHQQAAQARVASQSPERRSEIARRAAATRWSRRKKQPAGYRLEDYTTEELAAGFRNRYEM